jgi:ketosteroid isomerase-like protein
MQIGTTRLAAALLMALLAGGCGLGGSSSDGPDAVMAAFLEAIRKGDDKTASELLTTLARQKTGEMEMVVAPPGSDTASFKVLEVEIEGDEAQVGTEWTDLDGDGRPRADKIVWMLRNEADGWRIHGMATRVFQDLAPIILNFEDPVDMLRKQRQAEDEIARRDAQLEATPENAAEGADATVR